MEDIFGIGQLSQAYSKPIVKLIEVCALGIGKVYEPTHIKRMAKARAVEMKLISAAIDENISTPILYTKGDIIIDSTSIEEMMQRSKNRIEYQELKKQNNIETIVSNAYFALENEEVVSDEIVDEDWITRFFDITGEISNEEMQDLWGQILCGEIKSPGSYSLRTLDLLKNMSHKEAKTFNKIAQYIIEDGNIYYIYNDIAILNKFGISILDIAELGEAGLISLESLSRKITLEPNNNYNFQYVKNIVFLNNGTENQIDILLPFYKLTKAGEEIFKLNETDFKENYLREIAEKMKMENIHLSYSEIVKKHSDSRIEYKLPMVELG